MSTSNYMTCQYSNTITADEFLSKRKQQTTDSLSVPSFHYRVSYQKNTKEISAQGKAPVRGSKAYLPWAAADNAEDVEEDGTTAEAAGADAAQSTTRTRTLSRAPTLPRRL